MSSIPLILKQRKSRIQMCLFVTSLCLSTGGFAWAQTGKPSESKSPLNGDRTFTIPLSSLQSWSQKVLVQLKDVTFTGNSGVHKLVNDCEMHFGDTVTGYTGDPPGFVMEPMNVCLEKCFGKSTYREGDWTSFGAALLHRNLQVEGVPRIWPEHLDGQESDSNPNHALEIHPLSKVITSDKSYDFSGFIYAPEGYPGGVGAETARAILEEIEVNVTRQGEDAEVDFGAGRIGNFTMLDVRFQRDNIKVAEGGHRTDAEVVLSRTKSCRVSLITVAGSGIDDQMKKLMTGRRKTIRFEALVLFSLDPLALLRAAEKGTGDKVAVENPIQLIVYGAPGDE